MCPLELDFTWNQMCPLETMNFNKLCSFTHNLYNLYWIYALLSRNQPCRDYALWEALFGQNWWEGAQKHFRGPGGRLPVPAPMGGGRPHNTLHDQDDQIGMMSRYRFCGRRRNWRKDCDHRWRPLEQVTDLPKKAKEILDTTHLL